MPNIDAAIHNADWTKQSWDIDASSVVELEAWLQARGITPEHFKSLPVFKSNVDKLPWLWRWSRQPHIAKSHVRGYTRMVGGKAVYVHEHEDSRIKAATASPDSRRKDADRTLRADELDDQTAAEAETYCARKWPGKRWRFTGMDAPLVKGIIRSQITFDKQFPEAMASLGGVEAVWDYEVKKDRADAATSYAYYVQNKGLIRLNNAFYRNEMGLQAILDRDISTGWHPSEIDSDCIFWHEFGHRLEHTIREQSKQGWLSGARLQIFYSWCAKNYSKMEAVSKYAKKDPDNTPYGEAWAESFSMTKFNYKELAGLLQDLHPDNFPVPTEPSPLSIAATYDKLAKLCEKYGLEDSMSQHAVIWRQRNKFPQWHDIAKRKTT